MIVLNIKDSYKAAHYKKKGNVKNNSVTEEKLRLLNGINKPWLFNTVVPHHLPNPELLNAS